MKLIMTQAIRTKTDATFGVNNAMPGNSAVLGQSVERVSDEPRMARQPRESSDLPIRSNPAFWNAGYDGQDQVVCGSASIHSTAVFTHP